ncbi:MAG: primosomal protein N' [Fibrobacter sp.]|jgi:primosomal protein N' (replication factor Y)|nr:primosomal protein N' [Fibrobacter sp.]
MTFENGQLNSCSSSETCGSVVSVAFPIAIPGLYDYRISHEFKGLIKTGTAVLVDVRNKQIWGVAVEIKSSSPYTELKPVLAVKNGKLIDDSGSLIKLYEWMASYYQCDIGRVFRPLVSKGLMNANAKTVQAFSVLPKTTDKLKPAYKQILDTLAKYKEFTCAQVERLEGIKKSAVAYLHKNGFLEKKKVEVLREADELKDDVGRHEILLSEEQLYSVEMISQELDKPKKPFLLYGITGSGKTHVYIELASRVLQKGRGVIILVPEITLTPQTIQRFRAVLGDVIAVIHSHMSDGERRDSLQELVTGNKKMVIGVRSAILAPVQNPGLIIVDEEHDGSYKQGDMEPRYNARDVAVMRGSIQNAVVLLGSATPSFESYYNSISGKYNLLKLSQRFGAATLPRVQIVDMAEEHRNNNWTLLSRYLFERIQQCLDQNRQVILLLNRRGFATVLLCKECGHSCMCPNCSVSLRYHRADRTVKCHLCGYESNAPDRCPSCEGEQIKYKGSGIQKAEELIRQRFPDARILRMDQDTTRRKGSHISILKEFADREADILIGTQMVSKGLNFPNVALVGVLQADTGLHFPDFRASEKTFQLLAQVAGRAGRADNQGEVVIQTYCPEEIAIKTAQHHDYEQFFNYELKNRQELSYPPFSRLARIIVEGNVEQEVKNRICGISSMLRRFAGPEFTILGPTPAVLERIANESRYSLLIKAQSARKLGEALREVRKSNSRMSKNLKVIIDVDPVNML